MVIKPVSFGEGIHIVHVQKRDVLFQLEVEEFEQKTKVAMEKYYCYYLENEFVRLILRGFNFFASSEIIFEPIIFNFFVEFNRKLFSEFNDKILWFEHYIRKTKFLDNDALFI